MTVFQKNVLSLLIAPLKNKKSEQDITAADWDPIVRLAEDQQLLPLLYDSLERIREQVPKNVLVSLNQSACRYAAINIYQNIALHQILDLFCQNQLDCMPLKGAVLKSVYPRSEMRVMSDIDILIHVEDYPKIREILSDAGWTEDYESDHELAWNNQNGIHLELHKRMIPSYTKDYAEYYGDGWKLARNDGDGLSHLSDEDFYIYLFIHFCKHYRDAGAGIKYILDFYVWRSKHPGMDENYIRSELQKLQVLTFYENVERLLKVWFEDAESDEITDFLTDKLFENGVWGNCENADYSNGIKEKQNGVFAKLKKAIGLLFPSFSRMKEKFPILAKLPILYPFTWIVRWIQVVFCRPQKITKLKAQRKRMHGTEAKQFEKDLSYVGLNFHFDV